MAWLSILRLAQQLGHRLIPRRQWPQRADRPIGLPPAAPPRPVKSVEPANALTTAEVAERLGCEPEQVRQLIYRGQLAATRRPRPGWSAVGWAITEDALSEYQCRQQAGTLPPTVLVAGRRPANVAVGQQWEFIGQDHPVPRGDYLVTDMDGKRVYLVRLDAIERPRWCLAFESWQAGQWRRLDRDRDREETR